MAIPLRRFAYPALALLLLLILYIGSRLHQSLQIPDASRGATDPFLGDDPEYDDPDSVLITDTTPASPLDAETSKLDPSTPLQQQHQLQKQQLQTDFFAPVITAMGLHYTPEPQPASIGMVTMLYGRRDPDYEMALKTHLIHAKMHDYKLFVLREQMLDGMWNKPAYILGILMEEMKKPEAERLEWIFWFDGDSVIINPRVPLQTFLPPPDQSHVHLLYACDWNGLNAGTFLIRVNWWAVRIMSGIVAFRYMREDDKLRFAEQSALELLIQEPENRGNATECPQRWFNAYSHANLWNETLHPHHMRRGDMLVHFPGVSDKISLLRYWSDLMLQQLPDWWLEVESTEYPNEAKEFWDAHRQNEENIYKEGLDALQNAKHLLLHVEAHLALYQIRLNESAFATLRQNTTDLREICDSQSSSEISLETATRLREIQESIQAFVEAAFLSTQRVAMQAIRKAGNIEPDPAIDPKGSMLDNIKSSVSKLEDNLFAVPANTDNIEKDLEELEKLTKVYIEAAVTAKEQEKIKAEAKAKMLEETAKKLQEEKTKKLAEEKDAAASKVTATMEDESEDVTPSAVIDDDMVATPSSMTPEVKESMVNTKPTSTQVEEKQTSPTKGQQEKGKTRRPGRPSQKQKGR